jgi:YD repeat protein
MVKAGKLGKINKIMDLLDPISNTMKIAGKTVKVTFNTTRRTFKYVINTAGKNFKRYELRFKIDGNTLYCGIPNGKISIIDKLKQADIEKLPVDENGIRIADIDGEAIPIGNKNALEKIEGKGVKIFSENLNTTISNLKKKAKYVLEGTGEYEKVGGHHPLAKKAFEGIEEYDYKKAFSVSKEVLEDIGDIGVHNKITGQQKSLYTEWRRANPNKALEIDEMAKIEIQAMINAGIPENVATGWVVKALEELKEKGVKSINNISWNGINN